MLLSAIIRPSTSDFIRSRSCFLFETNSDVHRKQPTALAVTVQEESLKSFFLLSCQCRKLKKKRKKKRAKTSRNSWSCFGNSEQQKKRKYGCVSHPVFSILTVDLDCSTLCTWANVRWAFDSRRAAGHGSHFLMLECFLSLGKFVSPYNSWPTLTFERSAQMPDESVHDRPPGVWTAKPMF